MTTLIAAYNSEGCIGRCDAKCYNATSPECDCICGGMNHGAGRQKAIANTTEMVETWIERYRQTHEVDHFEISKRVIQPALPGFDGQQIGVSEERIRV